MNQPAHAQGDLSTPAGSCVVLTGSTSQEIRDLIAGLERRRLQTIPAGDEVQVMVALGEAETDVSALVIHEPSRHEQFEELIRAVRRYYPKTLCWQYESAGCGLVPVERQKEARPPDSGPRTPDSRLRTPDSRPAKLTGTDRWLDVMRDDAPASRPLSELPTPPELTEQELAMLLGTGSDPQSPAPTELDDDDR